MTGSASAIAFGTAVGARVLAETVARTAADTAEATARAAADAQEVTDRNAAIAAAIAQNVPTLTIASGSTATAYVTTATAITGEPTDKTLFIFTPDVANTGSATLKVNGGTARGLRTATGSNLVANTLAAGRTYAAQRVGAVYRLLGVEKHRLHAGNRKLRRDLLRPRGQCVRGGRRHRAIHQQAADHERRPYLAAAVRHGRRYSGLSRRRLNGGELRLPLLRPVSTRTTRPSIRPTRPTRWR
jgi:hypothetical protein